MVTLSTQTMLPLTWTPPKLALITGAVPAYHMTSTTLKGILRPVNRAIKGFGGTRTWNVQQGTIIWKFCDDNGMQHKFRIPNSYYVPDGKLRLLSPQHWAKTQSGGLRPHGPAMTVLGHGARAGELTTSKSCTLFWNHGRNRLTVPLGPMDNVATFHLAPGFRRFALFCQRAQIDYSNTMDNPLIADSTLISDDEEEEEDIEPPLLAGAAYGPRLTGLPIGKNQLQLRANRLPRNVYRLPHHSILMAHQLAPSLLSSKRRRIGCPHPQRQNYSDTTSALDTYQWQNCRAWQNKASSHQDWRHAPFPPAVHAYMPRQLEKDGGTNQGRIGNQRSSQPSQESAFRWINSHPRPLDLLHRLTGRLTTKRYRHATVFVDQYSGLGYVYPQKTATAEETVEAKKSFEAYCESQGVQVRAYHTDNGVFRANQWVKECFDKRQQLTFAGVNAHHSKWPSRAPDPFHTRSCARDANPCQSQMAQSHNHSSMAIRRSDGKRCHQPMLQTLKTSKVAHHSSIFSNTDINVHSKHWKPFGMSGLRPRMAHSKAVEAFMESGKSAQGWEFTWDGPQIMGAT